MMRAGFDGGGGDVFGHGDDVVAGCLNWDLKDWNVDRLLGCQGRVVGKIPFG